MGENGKTKGMGAAIDMAYVPGSGGEDVTLREGLLMALCVGVDFLAAWASCHLLIVLLGVESGWAFGAALVVFFFALVIHFWGLDTVREARRRREAKAFAEKSAAAWRKGGAFYQMQAPLDPPELRGE